MGRFQLLVTGRGRNQNKARLSSQLRGTARPLRASFLLIISWWIPSTSRAWHVRPELNKFPSKSAACGVPWTWRPCLPHCNFPLHCFQAHYLWTVTYGSPFLWLTDFAPWKKWQFLKLKYLSSKKKKHITKNNLKSRKSSLKGKMNLRKNSDEELLQKSV